MGAPIRAGGALNSVESKLLTIQREKLRTRNWHMTWGPKVLWSLVFIQIPPLWFSFFVISLKMPTGAVKVCNQRPQSLMSRERGGGEGPAHQGASGQCRGERRALTWARVRRTRRGGHRERKMDRQERTGEKGGVSIVRKRLCCSWSPMARLGQEEGQSQRAPELKS